MNEEQILDELKICYVEQFGPDITIGEDSYLNMSTVFLLCDIMEDIKKLK